MMVKKTCGGHIPRIVLGILALSSLLIGIPVVSATASVPAIYKEAFNLKDSVGCGTCHKNNDPDLADGVATNGLNDYGLQLLKDAGGKQGDFKKLPRDDKKKIIQKEGRSKFEVAPFKKPPPPVPEVGTTALVGLGLVALLVVVRRYK